MISVVIPIYNEEDLIDILYEKVVNSLEKFTKEYEVICVNDGSSDKSLEKLLSCNKNNHKFKVVDLSRNFGHQAAYTAGLNYAKGKYIVMMDGDLQDPPELIEDMYNKIINEQVDIVYAKRKERQETFVKKSFINLFHRIFNKMSNINAPKNVGNFSIMNKKALDSFLSLSEKNRYLPGLRFFIGFKQSYIEYDRPDREIGEAKMNFIKLSKLALDAIFSFSNLPIKVCLFLGIIGVVVFFFVGVFAIVSKLIGTAIPGWSSTLLSIYFLGSIQLLFMGVIGEYVHRIYIETQNRPIFIVRDFYD